MENKTSAVEKIINEQLIDIVFQPILSLKTGMVLGYEALSRTPLKTTFHNIEEVFLAAKESNRLWDLERLSRKKALEAAKSFMVPPFNKKLFLNVSPEIMNNEKFRIEITEFFLDEFQISPHNIIFEVTEKNMIDNLQGFQTTISLYKTDDFKFALNHSKLDFSETPSIHELNTNYIKIDMKLIRNIDKESLQRAIVKGMVEYAKTEDIALIAEGVETYEELETVIRLGVDFAQGYYIQKPKPEIYEMNARIVEQVLTIRALIIQEDNNAIGITPVRELYSKTKTIASDALTIEAYEMMNRDVNCTGLTIVEDNKPIGIITKEKLAVILSGRYGFTLYQNKPVSKIMDPDFLAVDGQMPVNIVADLAMERPHDKLYDFIVVNDNDQFLGTVTIKKMLRKATELKVSSAKEQSPLTGLPGNMAIEHKLSNLMNAGNDFSVTYIDIDHFKPYNDVYGFEAGDMIIKLLAKILREQIPSNQFIGHIGGDDFVVILDYHIPLEKINEVVRLFEQKVIQFYDPSDVEKGFVTAKSRSGKLQKFPLISITAVSINNRDKEYHNTNEISVELANLKNKAKQKKANLLK